MLQRNVFTGAATFVVALTFAGIASAQTCATLPSHAKLKAALEDPYRERLINILREESA